MTRRVLGSMLLLMCSAVAGMAADLTTVSAIRGLSPEAIAAAPDFEVTARVTFIAAWKGRTEMSVQDETAGIYTYITGAGSEELRLGDELLLKGKVRAGVGPPCLEVSEFSRTGAKFLPDARPADFGELESGAVDSQFVEIEGVVRDVQHDVSVAPPSTIVTLQMKGGRAEVFLALKTSEGLTGLVDSQVRVRGVPFHYFNRSNQPFGFRFMTCERSQMEVVKSAPQPPFEMPLTRVEKLLRYEPVVTPGHRVRVRGIVTLHWPGELLYLQDGDVGILVKSRRTEKLRPGDRVDVVAFAAMSGYSAILEDAEFRKMESAEPPAVVELSLQELVEGEKDARLVTTEGVLESISERNGRALLTVRKGPLMVPAELPVRLEDLPSIEAGSRVKLTGVCQVELGSRRKFAAVYRPESAKILLRSVADVEVLESASWWTARRLTFALTGMLLVLGVAMAWAVTVQSKNTRLKREILGREQAEAKVRQREEERKIFATDLHDSLEQSLTGVALQLQAAGKQSRNEHLELAERLLKHSRDEVHRAVRDLREPMDGDFDLAEALNGLVKRASAGSMVDFKLDLPERMPVLAGHLGQQLLHFAQEGVTNALKHAEAKSIRVGLSETADTMALEIADDGNGFDRSNAPGPVDGHFGIQGMKERAARLGGTFGIDSAAGDGTRLRIVLPKNP